ncbi:Rep [Molossus molossus associated circovirus 2]|nr:Rep [Molossus molossus associated circovirus 2]
MSKSRNWVFTDNNPSTDQPSWTTPVKYAIWQKERGENGTEHLQGYVEYDAPRSLGYCKSILPRAHWEIRRGTQQQAMDYASKEATRIGGPWTHGTLNINAPGTRTDLIALQQALDEGRPLREITKEQFPAMRTCYKFAVWYRMLTSPSRDWAPRIYLLIGPPGCGKTSFCKRVAPDAYWKQCDSKWWDGYDGQHDVVLDDFFGWIQFRTMLRLCDRYPELVESKGGQHQFLAKRIFITSNGEPREWYPNIPEHRFDALQRRIREFGVRITDYSQDLLNA